MIVDVARTQKESSLLSTYRVLRIKWVICDFLERFVHLIELLIHSNRLSAQHLSFNSGVFHLFQLQELDSILEHVLRAAYTKKMQTQRLFRTTK